MPTPTKYLLIEQAASALLDTQEALGKYKEAHIRAIAAGATYEEIDKVKKRLKRLRKKNRRFDEEAKRKRS